MRFRDEVVLAVAAILALGAAAHAQSPGPKFEVASVKVASTPTPPAAPGAGGVTKRAPGTRPDAAFGGPGTSDPGRIHYPRMTMEAILLRAFGVSGYRLAAPGWVSAERYDIDATMPPDTTRGQLQVMLQNLLAERFEMKTHRETREVQGCALTTAKNPKLHESAAADPKAGAADDAPMRPGPDGYFPPPRGPGVFIQMAGRGGARATFRQVSMQGLAETLEIQLKRPVRDATGLTALYDFVLDYSAEGLDFGSERVPVSMGDGEAKPDLANALQSQLGLKLEAERRPVDVIVIDRLEKTPSGN